MGWYGGGPSVDRNATANPMENALGLPLRCEAETATASSPTLRPRREVLPPSESTHARDHATFSEDPCGPICSSRASPSSSGRIRSMIPVDEPRKWVELRSRRWSPPPIPRWNRERQHLSYCPRVDPKLSRRFPSAQTLDLNCVTSSLTSWLSSSLPPSPGAPRRGDRHSGRRERMRRGRGGPRAGRSARRPNRRARAINSPCREE